MAKKISELTPASALTGSELLEIVQSMASRRTTIADLLALVPDLYKGLYTTLAALNAAHPSSVPGAFADVDSGSGSNVQRYIWDNSDNAWVLQAGSGGGMANPMTTAGDIIVGTTGGTPSRLALGSALQTLRVNAAGTGLEYAAASGGADNSTETVAISSGTLNLSATTKEVIVVDLNQNVTTITMPAGVAGQAVNRRIVFTQSGAANFTIAGWGSVTIEGGTAPVAATGVGAVTEYMLSNTSNGGWRMYVDQSGGELSRGTAQNTTGGTAVDFTGIPSWARRITVLLNGVSLSGTSDVLIRLMVGGTAVSTGYLSTCSALGTTTAVSQSTAGMIIRGAAAVSVISGAYTFNEISANTWVGSFAGKQSNSAGLAGAGDVAVAGEVDGIRITTVNGTDTFDAGSVNIMWE